MIFLLQHFFLLAIDLVLAVTLSCLFYAIACIAIAFLTCFIIIFSFGTMERNIDVKGRAVVVLVSNSSIGRMFARNLDKAGFRVSAVHWPTREKGTAKEESSSNMEVAQLHMTEDEYQKTVKTFVESHLSLKGPAEEGHFGSQSTHHEASPTADPLRRGDREPQPTAAAGCSYSGPSGTGPLTLLYSSEASSRPAAPVIRSYATLHGPGYIPPSQAACRLQEQLPAHQQWVSDSMLSCLHEHLG